LFFVLFAVALARQVRTGDRWLVKQGPPVPDRATSLTEQHVTV
jgi:hypothetical protein